MEGYISMETRQGKYGKFMEVSLPIACKVKDVVCLRIPANVDGEGWATFARNCMAVFKESDQ